MKKSNIGVLSASVIGLGTWAMGGGPWWGSSDKEQCVETVGKASAAGINLIDTAPGYGFGQSEEIVGKAIVGRRDEVLISTKCGLWWEDGRGTEFFELDGRKVRRCLEPDTIRREIEMSLRRLGVGCIDIYFTHWQSVEPGFTPIDKTMNCLMDLKRQGLIKAIGASNVSVAHLSEYGKYGKLDVIQEKYSILDRRIEAELLPFCIENNIAVMAYSPMEQGLLTGSIDMDYKPDPASARAGIPWIKRENRRRVLDMLEAWGGLVKKYGCTLSQLVLACTAGRRGITHVLCGARKPGHIAETAAAANITLEQADADRMWADVAALGEPI